MKPLAVFDLDGTLADVTHRVHHVEQRPKNWDAFFAAAVDDPPLSAGLEMVRAAAGDCEIAYLTGRPERCRQDTLDWLARHELPEGELVMRPERERRPARLTKPGMLARLAADRVVAVVVDDDDAAVEAYREAGWPVLHATWAEESAGLQQAQESDGRT